jgi:hypothetical protein
MGMVVLGLMRDPHQARGLVRALDDAGFDLEAIDTSGNMLPELSERGVPAEDAQYFAEGARRGGAVVCVCTETDSEASRAAELMAEHGALDIDACATHWKTEPYALTEGEYPAAAGRMYRDPRTRPSPAVRTPGASRDKPYRGPERRVRDQPYVGVNRRMDIS